MLVNNFTASASLSFNYMSTELNEEKFKPKGAIAFFVLLIVLCLVIWFGIYAIMISRS